MSVIRQTILIIITLCISDTAWSQSNNILDLRGMVELHALSNNSSQSWYSGGFAKLRYDDDSLPVQLGKAALHADLRLTDTFWLRSLVTAYTDPGFDPNLIEAYLSYRPVPRGPLQIRVKAGAFHLPISLENKGFAWSSLYSTTPSVINTWIGEELRVIGTEVNLAMPGRFRQSAHDFSITAGAFGLNDGAATIIAYRGWSQHDRQTGLGDNLRLIPEFPDQIRQFGPFREIDDRVGFYLGGSWEYQRRVQINMMHYDNRADPTAMRDGQIAWHTSFDHVSIQFNLPKNTRLIGQYLFGDTFLNNQVTGFMAWVEYSSWYLMLSQRINEHRISARYERFDTDDLDTFKTAIHNSNEDGWGWLISYRYQLNKSIQIGAEWLQLKTNRDSRFLSEGIRSETESQLLLNFNYRF